MSKTASYSENIALNQRKVPVFLATPDTDKLTALHIFIKLNS